MSDMKRVCTICKDPNEEVRPYGAGGSYICFPCMSAEPEREEEAKRQLEKRFNAAGPVSILTEDGPKKLLVK